MRVGGSEEWSVGMKTGYRNSQDSSSAEVARFLNLGSVTPQADFRFLAAASVLKKVFHLSALALLASFLGLRPQPAEAQGSYLQMLEYESEIALQNPFPSDNSVAINIVGLSQAESQAGVVGLVGQNYGDLSQTVPGGPWIFTPSAGLTVGANAYMNLYMNYSQAGSQAVSPQITSVQWGDNGVPWNPPLLNYPVIPLITINPDNTSTVTFINVDPVNAWDWNVTMYVNNNPANFGGFSFNTATGTQVGSTSFELGPSGGGSDSQTLSLGTVSPNMYELVVATCYPSDDPSDTFSLAAAVVAPEPSTFALLGIGTLGLLAYEWRRRTAKA